MDIVNLFEDVLYRKPSALELKLHTGELDDKKNELLSCHERLFNHEYVINKKGQSPLKIALMLTGHWRRFEASAHVWKNFKKLHPNVDIFIHTWNSRGNRSDINWIIETNEDLPNFELICDILKPITFIKEDNTKFIDSFGLSTKYPDKTIYMSLGQKVSNHQDFSKFVMSQLYGIYKCYQAVQNYSEINNFTYDVIIKLRADTLLYHPLIFPHKLPDDSLYIHSRSHFHRDGGRGCKLCDIESKTGVRLHDSHSNDVCDVLLYGSAKVMDRYCNLYLHIPELLDQMHLDNLDNLTKWPENNAFVTKKNNITYFSWCGNMDKNLKLFYPERLIREYMKDYWLISDPYYL